nr:MAG TPA: hypothetical protein [Caudoviricetes sp.]
MKKLIPADTVDANGTVWETVGENIRRGEKEFSDDTIKEIVNILFPVGSVYCGENSFILSVGVWTLLVENAGRIIRSGNTVKSGDSYKSDMILTDSTSTDYYVSLRMYRRTA